MGHCHFRESAYPRPPALPPTVPSARLAMPKRQPIKELLTSSKTENRLVQESQFEKNHHPNVPNLKIRRPHLHYEFEKKLKKRKKRKIEKKEEGQHTQTPGKTPLQFTEYLVLALRHMSTRISSIPPPKESTLSLTDKK